MLDAGCGSGLSILALLDALRARQFSYRSLHGFDLTTAMVERCRAALDARGVKRVELRQADVCQLSTDLPSSWRDYDLIICSSMLEYVPRDALADSLTALAARLSGDGTLLALVTRKSFYPTRWLWHCNGYSRQELRHLFGRAGLGELRFRHYPARFAWLNVGNHVIEAAPAARREFKS